MLKLSHSPHSLRNPLFNSGHKTQTFTTVSIIFSAPITLLMSMISQNRIPYSPKKDHSTIGKNSEALKKDTKSKTND